MRKFLLVILLLILNAYSATLTISSPAGGDVLMNCNGYNINWSYVGGATSKYKIELLYQGALRQTIASSLSSSPYHWDVQGLPNGGSYSLRVTAVATSTVGTSGTFSITTAQNLLIKVVSPTNDSIWQALAYVAVKWKNVGCTGSTVRLDLCNNWTVISSIVAGQANTTDSNLVNTYWWTIPNSVPSLDSARIKITSESNAALYGHSLMFKLVGAVRTERSFPGKPRGMGATLPRTLYTIQGKAVCSQSASPGLYLYRDAQAEVRKVILLK